MSESKYEEKYSSDLCTLIFYEASLRLLGLNPKCRIYSKYVDAELDDTNTLQVGDTLDLIPNSLMRSKCTQYINNFD